LTLNSTGLAGFSNQVQLTANGLPAGAVATFSANPVTANGSATVTISNLLPTSAGVYTVTFTGTSGSTVQNMPLTLSLLPGAPTASAIANSPIDGATGASLLPTLNWSAVPFAESYLVEASTSPTFSPLLYTNTLTTTSATLTTSLNTASVVYWRVKASNPCGQGVFSSINAFQTGAQTCNQVFNSIDVPKAIDPALVVSVTSNNIVNVNKSITDVNVTTTISHTYVGDVSAILISPANDTVELFNQPGFPATQFGCSGDNIAATFDDEATQTAAIFESTCNNTPAITGIFKPLTALTDFDGENANGTWKLIVSDAVAEDGGSITSWSLNLCLADAIGAGAVLINQTLTVPFSATTVIPTSKLQAQASGASTQVIYTIISLPINGSLWLNGVQIGLGATFTQGNIDANQLSYRHGGNAAATDFFKFDVLDQNNSGWVHNGTFNVNIIQNAINASAAQVQAISCFNGNNGALNVSASGGTAPLSYSLNGGTAQNSNYFADLVAGTYSVVVKDATGFTLTTNTVTLSNPSQITVTANVSNDDITVNANGGTGTLNYSINGSAFGTGNYFENLANGTYSIVVRDVNGCTKTTTATIAVNTISATAQIVTQVACNNGNNGAVNVNANGGTAPLQYSLNGAAQQTSNYFANLSAGSYTIVVTDALSFVLTTNTVVLNNPSAVTAAANVNASNISASGTGGSGSYTYSIDGQNFIGNNYFPNLNNGVYDVTVKDGNGCTASANAVVAVNTLLAGLQLTTPITCIGNANAVITVNAAGGQLPYQYSLNGATFQGSNVFFGLAAGNYSVNVKDNFGLSITSSVLTINNPAAISASATSNLNVVTVNATGGTGTLQYSLNGGTFQQSNVFQNVANGNYTITVKDVNGCTTTTSVTISVAALSGTASSQGIACFGSTGTIIASASAGVAPYQYSLDNGTYQTANVFQGVVAGSHTVNIKDNAGAIFPASVTLSQPTQILATATVFANDISMSASGGNPPYQYSFTSTNATGLFYDVANGTYSLTITDANNCTVIKTVNVNYSALGGASQSVNATCNGMSDGQISVSAANGVAPYQYALNGGTFQIPAIFSGLGAGTYTVTIRDAAGDLFTVNGIAITAPNAIAVSATATGTSIAVSATGGTGPFLYSLDGGGYQAGANFTNVSGGTHSINVKDANGCVGTASVLVIVPLVSEISGVTGVTCAGGVNGIAQVCVSSGVAPFTFASTPIISNVNAVAGFCTANFNLSGLSAGVYNVTVSDANGSTQQLSFTISAPTVVTAAATASGSSVTVTASGGTGTLQFSLDGGVYQPNSIFVNVSAGAHTITVKDQNGCTTTTTVTVDVVAMVASVMSVSSVSCAGDADGEAEICINGGILPYTLPSIYTFSEVTGNCNGNFVIRDLASGNYSLTLTDAAGSTKLITFSITTPSALALTVGQDFNDIIASASGGTAPLKYSINGVTFQNSGTFANLPVGNYVVTVEDANGCTAVMDFVLDYIGTVDVKSQWGIDIAPNPSTGVFALKINENTSNSLHNQGLNGSIFNTKGQLLRRFDIAQGTASFLLDLSDMPNGVYVMQLMDGTNVGTVRLVKL
jgi:subtilisin-like proprotein convertase family protein